MSGDSKKNLRIESKGQTMDRQNDSTKKTLPLWIQLFVWLGLLGLLVLVALGLTKAKSPVLRIGSTVPDFSLAFYRDYEYESSPEISLSDLRGKVLVLNFWASWCKPCESEAADIESAWRYFQPSGKVLFIGIDYVDTEPEARSYLARFDISYPNAPDLATKISQTFNRNLGVPETYVIDQEGILQYIKIGPFVSVDEIIRAVEPLLEGD
jgi:cytochrome c biogenesis protein CcmG, thiol:disulfide interchange protein DsbE